jgi:Ca2+/H+ antiporter, TMEM165/GDT1 family
MVSLAEWGDKSQIATIALAASNNSLFVGAGVFAGHVVCCALAVLCGQFFSKYVNEYVVLLSSGVIFLCFGFWYALTLF